MAAEEVEKSEKAKGEGKAKNPGQRKNIIILGAFVGVMLAEALVVFVLVKSFAAPLPTAAKAAGIDGLDAGEGVAKSAEVEVPVVKFRAQNEKSQRLLIYDFEVYATVSSGNAEAFQAILTSKAATIKDRYTRVVRASDPQWFTEPDLTTLRGQFKHELSQIVGDEEMILEVLIPSIVSYSED